ncbi:RES domain-containing protein [Phocoenobacter atlanticus]|uniref:RES domain-containing protein n=1 Tax=Phocoenobacter atlanticus TaxID=3416742 RepID=UPI0027450B1A|nr:RES domain-containing protein [Pasteurella atlantica]MDP8101025.1 RES domain-containing protein [Pasteurella atlantica]
MNCCINCFESQYIRAIISNNNTQGICDFCKSRDIYIYEPSELNIFLKGIIDLYIIDSINGKPLDLQIKSDFDKKVFSQILFNTHNTKKLIAEILKDDITDYRDVLENPVRLKFDNTENDINQELLFSWDKFSEEIKTINRFHLNNPLDLERLKLLFNNFGKEIPKGKKFHRARICVNKQGYNSSEMGSPPNEKATGGRANPSGISYLYLSSDITTTLYETRASLFDYVSVGTFRLEKNIKVVNLSRNTYDVFRLAELDTLEDVIIHGNFIDKLEQELSKPRRKNDSELDYLPTQYLSELIKSMGFDGIEFKSSLYSEGTNLAIFNPEKFKCLEVKVYDITNIKLDFKELSNL